ncbi:hypothetical protein D7V82_13370 [bacterium 1xD8-6]|nr:hypothetical protein D7V72_18170 [bacterium D16-36]RKI67327.1 hypothetical protein D7V82_13370 [bacterium 1xD8-6]
MLHIHCYVIHYISRLRFMQLLRTKKMKKIVWMSKNVEKWDITAIQYYNLLYSKNFQKTAILTKR